MSAVSGAAPSSVNARISVRPPPITSTLFGVEAGSVFAPTVITRRPEAGEPIVASPGPLLPADATTMQPASAALSAATDDGSSGVAAAVLPRLILIMCATGFG